MSNGYDDEWEEGESSPFMRWTEPGDSVTGKVVEYNPIGGGKTYQGDECGRLVLEINETGDRMQVDLDKGALADPVKACNPRLGDFMKVEFSEWKTSKSDREYKFFRAFIRRQKSTGGRGSSRSSSAARQALEDRERPGRRREPNQRRDTEPAQEEAPRARPGVTHHENPPTRAGVRYGDNEPF